MLHRNATGKMPAANSIPAGPAFTPRLHTTALAARAGTHAKHCKAIVAIRADSAFRCGAETGHHEIVKQK